MRVSALLARRHEYRVLALMLMVLHGALWLDFGGDASRPFLLAHFGLFLLWQPIWRREERIETTGLTLSVVALLAILTFIDWWLIAVWLVLLIGLVGGRLTEGRAERTTYMMTMVFLVSELLIGAIPPIFEVKIWGLVQVLTEYGLPLIPLAMLFIPARHVERRAHAIDFLYGLTVSLLVSVLAMGALLRWYDARVDYSVALFQTTLGIAAFLLAVSWLWAPFAGFSGLGQLWTRYLMNIGTPFESWLERIASMSRRVHRPEDFLSAAMRELVELPWVRGVSWRSPLDAPAAHLGERADHAFSVREEGLEVTVYTYNQVGTALSLHGRLLVGLLAHFHRAKEHEAELTSRAHMEAVHQTGARITHDIKNLLQSLYSLTSAIEGAHQPQRRQEALALLERQLPQLTGRLQLSLDKLQAPIVGSRHNVPIDEWWRQFCQRHEGPGVALDATIEVVRPVPADLFDSVAENLLDNALYKRRTDPAVTIDVSLRCNAAGLRLAVRDSGHGLSAQVAADLMRIPVQSASGLGIGLFQSARHAEQLGFRLAAPSLLDGHVEFELVSTPAAWSAQIKEEHLPPPCG